MTLVREGRWRRPVEIQMRRMRAREHGYRWHEFGDSHLILP